MRRVLVGVLASAALAGGGGASATGRTQLEGLMERQFVFSTQTSFRGGVNAAFFAGGRAIVAVTGNRGAEQILGWHELTLPEDVFARLEALKKQAWAAPADTEPTLPGTALTSFGELIHPPGTSDFRDYPQWSVPAEWKPLLAEIDRLLEQVLQHPIHAVRGAGRAVHPELEPGAPVAFEVSLTSIGSEPATFVNPLWTSAEEQELTVQLVVEREPRGGARTDREDDTLWVELSPKNVTAGPGASPGRTITLSPGAELKLAIKKKLLLSPGAYRAYAIWQAGSSPPGRRHVEGTLRIELGRFVVRRAEPRR